MGKHVITFSSDEHTEFGKYFFDVSSEPFILEHIKFEK
jgi:hypothetical protein